MQRAALKEAQDRYLEKMRKEADLETSHLYEDLDFDSLSDISFDELLSAHRKGWEQGRVAKETYVAIEENEDGTQPYFLQPAVTSLT